MNTLLETLFEKYNFSPKDRYEINQIYSLLSPDKRQNLLKNFPILAGRISKIQDELETERDILVPKAIESIKAVMIMVEKKL